MTARSNPRQTGREYAPECDYCDLPAAYAICVERACERHASDQLKETAAMEIRRANLGREA